MNEQSVAARWAGPVGIISTASFILVAVVVDRSFVPRTETSGPWTVAQLLAGYSDSVLWNSAALVGLAAVAVLLRRWAIAEVLLILPLVYTAGLLADLGMGSYWTGYQDPRPGAVEFSVAVMVIGALLALGAVFLVCAERARLNASSADDSLAEPPSERERRLLTIDAWLQVTTSALLALGAILSLFVGTGDDYLQPAVLAGVIVVYALASLPVARTVWLANDIGRGGKPLVWLGIVGLIFSSLFATGAFNVGYAAATIAWAASVAVIAYAHETRSGPLTLIKRRPGFGA